MTIDVAAMSRCLKTLSDQTRLIMMRLFLEKNIVSVNWLICSK